MFAKVNTWGIADCAEGAAGAAARATIDFPSRSPVLLPETDAKLALPNKTSNPFINMTDPFLPRVAMFPVEVAALPFLGSLGYVN
jgi:hypothetical protein